MTKFGKLEAHLLTRNYRHDVHPYRQWIDESEGVVTFPLYRFDGMLAVTNGAIVIHTQRLKSDPGGNLLS